MRKSRRPFNILLGLIAAVLILPVAAGIWVGRGDPDIRLDSHRSYLAEIAGVAKRSPPNIVLVLADDLGYGDVSSFGSRAIRTPNIDGLASEGIRLTDFYAASPVCSPSRFSYLTGRYPTRGFIHSVFFPSGTPTGLAINTFGFPRGIRGIPADEITVAEALRAAGYATGMFGKWHLGDRSPHLPTDKGFEYFFGSYYSNDMKPYAYYRNGAVAIEAPADQTTLTRALTEEIRAFIARNADGPFFVYYPSPFPHDPVHSSDDFEGSSRAGAYGDCVEELDWSVGQIRAKLAELGLGANTLFVVTSDNGPWHEGSSGPFRGRKANSFEGGQLVPFVASWPRRIAPGVESGMPAMSIDLLPTFLEAAGIPRPADRAIDGVSLVPLLTQGAIQNTDRSLFFVSGGEYVGVRTPENLKYLAAHRSENSAYWIINHGPFLFDLDRDPTESYDLSARLPAEHRRLAALVRDMNEENRRNPRGWRSP